MDKLTSSEALQHQELMDLFDEVNTQVRNMAFAAAGLAIGTGSKKKVKIVNTVTYLSDGIFKSKTTAEVDFTATTHDITADASNVKEACYLLTLAADGTPTITMGSIATGAGNAKLPERPATGTPIGYVRIAVDAGSTDFNATTDDLDAAHLTVSYVDLGFLGARFDAEQ